MIVPSIGSTIEVHILRCSGIPKTFASKYEYFNAADAVDQGRCGHVRDTFLCYSQSLSVLSLAALVAHLFVTARISILVRASSHLLDVLPFGEP